MKFIETLREGERIQEVYLCKQKNVAMTKSHDIIQGAGVVMHFIKNIFTFGKAGGKKQKKKER